jgi:hypothetical protein
MACVKFYILDCARLQHPFSPERHPYRRHHRWVATDGQTHPVLGIKWVRLTRTHPGKPSTAGSKVWARSRRAWPRYNELVLDEYQCVRNVRFVSDSGSCSTSHRTNLVNGWPPGRELPRAPLGWNWRSTTDVSPCCVIQPCGEGIPDKIVATALSCGHLQALPARLPDKLRL